jgi:hypothetical protein
MANDLCVGDIVEFALGEDGYAKDLNGDLSAATIHNGRLSHIYRSPIMDVYSVEGFSITGVFLLPASHLRAKNEKINVRCECGGNKTKTPHSSWCPLY